MPAFPASICVNRNLLSATTGLEALAAGLNGIKRDAGQSDAVLADPLYKSPDRVRDYRLAQSEMGAITFARGVAAWGEAFGGPLMALAGYRLTRLESAKPDALPVSGLLHKLIAALEDGSISDAELLGMAREVQGAGAVVDGLRERLGTLLAGAR